ncbi:MAG: lytic transglycosylase domain-containing protein [Desulfosarcina sp.]|nr:lytic transglycosylase domain-containing protein [Desulfobacterales bacterium]
MIRATHKTIRDYGGWRGARPPAVERHVQGGATFRRIIQAACRDGDQTAAQRDQGLTIQDYLGRAVVKNPQLPLPATRTEIHSAPAASGNTPPAAKEVVQAKPVAAREVPVASDAAAGQGLIRRRIERAIEMASRQYDLPADLIRSIIRHESNFNPRAESQAGAQGLMQLMPATACELGVSDSFDVRQNIDGGTRYLKQMLDHFDGDLRKALAAYNAGPGTVRRYDGVPPYPETRNYVHKVMVSAGVEA